MFRPKQLQHLTTSIPSLRTVKLSLTSESDNYMERLTTLTQLQEVVVSFLCSQTGSTYTNTSLYPRPRSSFVLIALLNDKSVLYISKAKTVQNHE